MQRTHCLTAVATLACLLAIAAGGNPSMIEESASPDYQTKFLLAPSTATNGQSITITVCTTNSAVLVGALIASITDVYINTSSNRNGATLLANCTVLALPAKGYTNWTTSVTIPSDQPVGQNYLIAVCNDNGHTMLESSFSNNTNIWAINISH